jgi:hypothetical protein
MGSFVLKDAFTTINAVDLSDHVKSIKVNYKAGEADDTAMGDDSVSRLAALKDFSLEITWNQDFAASEVDATLFPLVGAAAFAIIIRPTSAAKSATNPEYTGNCILTEYTPLDGTVGDLAKATTSMPGSGDLARGV